LFRDKLRFRRTGAWTPTSFLYGEVSFQLFNDVVVAEEAAFWEAGANAEAPANKDKRIEVFMVETNILGSLILITNSDDGLTQTRKLELFKIGTRICSRV
jgi:hypothetical protein